MDEETELLNFNYPLESAQQIKLEVHIKQQLRDNALNIPEEKDIERYSDRYAFGISHEDVPKFLNLELLSPELQRMYGFASINEAIAMPDEINEDEHASVFSAEVNDDESLAGGDDYNFYEGEDFVDEQNNGGNEEVL